jgi:DNA helicase II / ATP-dependent DNA helicase PcrA
MPDYLNSLNPAQREAVTFGISKTNRISDPLLIIAGAGSGKTNTLAYRVAHLICNGADPRKILLLTFTRRAAEEMINRAEKVVQKAKSSSTKEVGTISWAGTFHSIANRLLRMYADAIGIDPSFTVLDRSDSADLMNKIRNDIGLSKKEKRFPKKDTCLDIYSYIVNAQSGIDEILNRFFPWCRNWTSELKSLFKRYSEGKRAMNVMDYDDLLLYWYFMVKNARIAESIGKRFDHILVDEYQDTNSLQAQILRNIKPDGKGLTVVGDDAQAIYSFRAATVKNILEFKETFQGTAQVITLERNYRSSMPILDASNAVISIAKQRFTKNLYCEKHSEEKPFLTTAEDESFQAEYVAKKILEYREAGIELREQAVLFRSSHHSAHLEIELGKRNIPFIKFGGLKFLETAHIKDIVAVLRWVENPRDTLAAFRVLQLLDGIGPAGAKKMLEFLEKNGFNFLSLNEFNLPAASKNAWPAFYRLLSTLSKSDTPWAGQVEQVRHWYKPHFDRIYDANPSREKDLEQLTLMAGTFKSRETFLSDLALNPPDLTSDESQHPLLDEDYLNLSTIHSAKGREWKVVFILNVADGWIPSDMATEDEEQIEEERRLLYVAMTRAKDHLHLSYPSRFYAHGFNHARADSNMYAIRSRFIPDSLLHYFTREVFGRESGEYDTENDLRMQPANVVEQVVGMWE